MRGPNTGTFTIRRPAAGITSATVNNPDCWPPSGPLLSVTAIPFSIPVALERFVIEARRPHVFKIRDHGE